MAILSIMSNKVWRVKSDWPNLESKIRLAYQTDLKAGDLLRFDKLDNCSNLKSVK